jgi:uncharacterized protein (DUF427 family)
MADLPEDLRRERARWRAFPRERPTQIERVGPGEESVWDYPRPPRLEPVAARVRVEHGGILLADSTAALRVCETSSPPTYYVPAISVLAGYLEASTRSTFCEWKGVASYWTIRLTDQISQDAAWSYADPDPAFEAIRDHLAFNAHRVDACYVGEDRVVPQPGGFYGGWITPGVKGPFKGPPGTERW